MNEEKFTRLLIMYGEAIYQTRGWKKTAPKHSGYYLCKTASGQAALFFNGYKWETLKGRMLDLTPAWFDYTPSYLRVEFEDERELRSVQDWITKNCNTSSFCIDAGTIGLLITTGKIRAQFNVEPSAELIEQLADRASNVSICTYEQ